MAGASVVPPLSCAVSVAVFLTCALTLSVAIHGFDPEDPIIRQVTESDKAHHQQQHSTNMENGLVGTERRFKSFMEKYGKTYSSREEYLHRLGIFAKNMIRAAEHQLLDPTAVHGVTPYSDLSEEEFESMYTGFHGGRLGFTNGVSETALPVDVADLPDNFDWREKGAVTEVKTQVITTPTPLFHIFFCFFLLFLIFII